MPFRNKVELHNGIYVVRNSLGLGTKVPGAGIGGLVKSVDFDGLTQYAASASATALPTSGAQSIAGWFKPTVSGTSKVIFCAVASADSLGLTNSVYVQMSSARYLDLKSYSGGALVANTQADLGSSALGSWVIFAATYDGASWTMRAGVLGSSLVASAADAATIPTTSALRVATRLASGANPHGMRLGILGRWDVDIFASGDLTTWLASPQSTPADAQQLLLCGDGDTIPTLTDSGSTGGWDLTAVNGPSIETDYPVAP